MVVGVEIGREDTRSIPSNNDWKETEIYPPKTHPESGLSLKVIWVLPKKIENEKQEER